MCSNLWGRLGCPLRRPTPLQRLQGGLIKGPAANTATSACSGLRCLCSRWSCCCCRRRCCCLRPCGQQSARSRSGHAEGAPAAVVAPAADAAAGPYCIGGRCIWRRRRCRSRGCSWRSLQRGQPSEQRQPGHARGGAAAATARSTEQAPTHCRGAAGGGCRCASASRRCRCCCHPWADWWAGGQGQQLLRRRSTTAGSSHLPVCLAGTCSWLRCRRPCCYCIWQRRPRAVMELGRGSACQCCKGR